MAAIINGDELALTGVVGADQFWGFEDGFDSTSVILALAQMGDAKDITVRLNSGGGIAWEGSAIHAAFARRKGKTTMVVEGIAASAASVIAMSGDDVRMSAGAMMMVHDPAGFTMGTIRDHEQQIACLTALGDSMATIYADKTKRSAADCREDMRAETWLTAEDAIAKGYADAMVADEDEPDEPIEPTPFPYRAYVHPPKHITALVKKYNWPIAAVLKPPPQPKVYENNTTQYAPKAETVSTSTPEEIEVTDKKDDDKTKELIAEAVAKAKADAAEIAKICQDGSEPQMATSLIAEGVSPEVAKERVGRHAGIKAAVAIARHGNPGLEPTLAQELIDAGKTIAEAQNEILKHLAAKSDENPVSGHHRAGAGGADKSGGEVKASEARAGMKANMRAELKRLGMVKEV